MNKNTKTLVDFMKYCEEHPEERFWQALRNWSGADVVLVEYKGSEFSEDTFFREGKDE